MLPKVCCFGTGVCRTVLNLGNVYGRKKEIVHAITCYRKAIELQPEDIKAHSYLVHQLQHGCYWKELEDAVVRLRKLAEPMLQKENNAGLPPFLALSISSDPRYNMAVSKSWCNHFFGRIQPINPPDSNPSYGVITSPSDRPVHIGYLSSDFINHATAHLMRSLFKTHDRSCFRVSAYSHGIDDSSAYRKDIISGCDCFEDIRDLSHEEAARKIAADGIDILVDLKGHTQGNRLEICAHRPAPIQVAYLGFPGTSGADFTRILGSTIPTGSGTLAGQRPVLSLIRIFFFSLVIMAGNYENRAEMCTSSSVYQERLIP